MAVENPEYEEEINLILKQLGKDLGSLTKIERKEVIKIYEEAQNMKKEKEEAKAVLKSSKINVTNMSKRTGYSNKTFYNNNHFLKDFVDLLTDKDDLDTNTNEKIRSLQNKNRELQDRLNAYIRENIVESQLIACENDELVSRVTELENSVRRLNELYNESLATIADLKSEKYVSDLPA